MNEPSEIDIHFHVTCYKLLNSDTTGRKGGINVCKVSELLCTSVKRFELHCDLRRTHTFAQRANLRGAKDLNLLLYHLLAIVHHAFCAELTGFFLVLIDFTIRALLLF